MTVKEGTLVTSTHKYKLAKLSPLLASKYSDLLMDDKRNSTMLEAWDLLMGLQNLATCVASLKKALDKKNGVPEPDLSASKYYTDIDE